MPGLDFYQAPPPFETHSEVTGLSNLSPTSSPSEDIIDDSIGSLEPYYNPRLDPQNYIEGPVSWNPSTRLRQMLARPGIVVSIPCVISHRGSVMNRIS
jgi:hypothetical protein